MEQIDSVKINPSLVMMREWKIIMLMLFSMLLMSSFAGNHKNYNALWGYPHVKWEICQIKKKKMENT